MPRRRHQHLQLLPQTSRCLVPPERPSLMWRLIPLTVSIQRLPAARICGSQLTPAQRLPSFRMCRCCILAEETEVLCPCQLQPTRLFFTTPTLLLQTLAFDSTS